MEEELIHISFAKRDEGTPSRFRIIFNDPLTPPSGMEHNIAFDSAMMSYSWHNINEAYKNKTVKYSDDGGTSWKTITFPNGCYSYEDLNRYVHKVMKDNKHTLSSGSDQYDSANRNTKFDVNLLYVPSLYKVIIEFANNYQVDLRNTEFGELIGFKKKLVTDTEYGTSLPNITNSVDELNINANIVSGSRVNGRKTNTIAVIPLNNLSRSYPFSYEPKRIYFNRISDNVSDITFSITDSINRPVDLNGIDWSMRLVLRVVPKK